MLIKIGASLSVMAQYVKRRGKPFGSTSAFLMHLHGHFGKTCIRKIPITNDERDAMREGENFASTCQAEFKALSQPAID